MVLSVEVGVNRKVPVPQFIKVGYVFVTTLVDMITPPVVGVRVGF